MTSNSDQLEQTEGITKTIARIEAQDATFVAPLREYLERFGCEVVVNREAEGPFLYSICVGDTDFVKSFFVDHDMPAQKKLAIIYEGDADDLSEVLPKGVKLYFLDPKPLTIDQTKEIFAFFFTAKQESMNARKELKTAKRANVITKEPPREQGTSQRDQLVVDTKRIAVTMRQIFAHTAVDSKRAMKTGSRFRGMRGIGIFLFIVMTPFFLYAASLGIGTGLLAASGKTLLAGNIPWAETFIRYSRIHIQNAQTTLHILSPALSFLGLEGFAEDQDRFLAMLSDASLAESGVVTIFQTSKDVGRAILFPKDTAQPANLADVQALMSEVTRVSQHLALVQAQLDSLLVSQRFPFQSGSVQDMGHRGLVALARVRGLIGYTEKLLALYPQMAGFRRKQTYLVLLQNSMELRPTGGFIGSLLLLSFVDGKVDDMHVVDVYTADGQLKGHIDPPLPIREIMGQEHWYLRDSNWDPDFSVSGRQAAWFYEKEMGQSVDGVIAVSLPFVTNLLHVIGPVEVPDFNERISEGNFFAKSLLYTQTDFFPGSTQKKDFLGALTTALLLRITSDRGISAGQLVRSIADSIQARDAQFYFTDPALEQLVTQWSWDGGVHVGLCQPIAHESTCIGDGIGVIEANLGINKVNYFVTHEALSDVTIEDDGTVRQTLTLKIHNTSPAPVSEGGGTYQAYIRLYYPQDTEIHTVKLDGTDVPFRPVKPGVPQAPYLETGITGSSFVVSVPFATAPRQERQLMVETSRALPTMRSAESYQFTIRKQAGVSIYPWHVVLHYPLSWTALSEGGIAKQGILEYNTDLTKDENIHVLFQKP